MWKATDESPAVEDDKVRLEMIFPLMTNIPVILRFLS